MKKVNIATTSILSVRKKRGCRKPHELSVQEEKFYFGQGARLSLFLEKKTKIILSAGMGHLMGKIKIRKYLKISLLYFFECRGFPRQQLIYVDDDEKL